MKQNKMLINGDKMNVMLFNTGHKYDCMPKLHLGNPLHLEVVEKFKLLGVHIRSDFYSGLIILIRSVARDTKGYGCSEGSKDWEQAHLGYLMSTKNR